MLIPYRFTIVGWEFTLNLSPFHSFLVQFTTFLSTSSYILIITSLPVLYIKLDGNCEGGDSGDESEEENQLRRIHKKAKANKIGDMEEES